MGGAAQISDGYQAAAVGVEELTVGKASAWLYQGRQAFLCQVDRTLKVAFGLSLLGCEAGDRAGHHRCALGSFSEYRELARRLFELTALLEGIDE